MLDSVLIISNYLQKKINFLDISRILLKILKLKEFQKYKRITPANIEQIVSLNKYVRLKINELCV